MQRRSFLTTAVAGVALLATGAARDVLPIRDFGGWKKVQSIHFAYGIFDQITKR